MKIYYGILIALLLGCYKKNDDVEALPVKDITFRTTLKNHTPGIDYIIDKSILVSKELIIEEGVEIMISDGCEINISGEGSIHANGSSGKNIILKSRNASGRWKGITVSSSGDNVFAHTDITGAGSAGNNHGGLEIKTGGNISLTDCRIMDNGDASALLINKGADCRISGNCELSNSNFPVQIDLHASLILPGTCKFNNNTHNVICVKNQDGAPLRTSEKLSLSQILLPYFFSSDLMIYQYQASVNAGVTLLFENNSGIRTTGGRNDKQAALTINGTSGQPVILGSMYSGQALWSGVNLSNGNSRIFYTTFRKTNSNIKTNAILNIAGSAQVECRYASFYADKGFCNISLIGQDIACNTDIVSRNTFANSLLPCIIL
jgi:hypothetical protein